MSIIHWHRPAEDEHGHDNPHELKISTYDWGDVASIAALLTSRERANGHEVIDRGGNWATSDRRPSALFFDLIVTLDGHEPMRWQHGVVESDAPWLKPNTPPTTPTPNVSRGIRVAEMRR